jgi:predicted enzyme related to lactoylglutathione lyase
MKNLISWVEIPATDFHRAVGFYSRVLETKFEVFDCESEKMACFPGGEGAISFAPGFLPSENGVLVSFNAGDDLDNTMKRVVENGGRIVQPKTKIEVENRGWFSIFIDSEGNKVGLYGDK